MKQKVKSVALALMGALLFGSVIASPAFADQGRHRGWHNRGHDRPVHVRTYRPCRSRTVCRHPGCAPRVRYYGTMWQTYDPGWSVRFDSDGDFGFSYGW